jgi:hypothetical protein
VQQFIEVVQEQIKSGDLEAFREQEIASKTEVFGKIAHRFSTYEAYIRSLYKRKRCSSVYVGFNSIQFIQVAGTWQVTSLAWNDQRPDRIMPAKYFEA